MNNECLLCEKMTQKLSVDKKACFKKLWLFQNLEQSDLAALSLHIQKNHFLPGQVVFQQGEPLNRMFIIYSGRIRLWKVTENGNEVTLDIRQSGDVLGENILHHNGPVPVNATCLETATICGLTKESFENLVLTNPNIGLQVIKNLSLRVDLLISRIGDMCYPNLEDRLHRILSTMAQEYGKKCNDGMILSIPFTHEDLAFLVGAHRVSITRAMKALQNSGRISRRGKQLVICEEVNG